MRAFSLAILCILLPIFAHASALININTANETTLDSLPYVTPTIATAIVEYRKMHAFVVIEDIMKVSGIKSGIFSHIQSLITVGDAGTTQESDTSGVASSTLVQNTVSTTTETVAVPTQSGGPVEYLPIPTLRIITGGARTVSSGADTAFTASVYDGKGNRRDDATVWWSFGDGMRRVGASVYHKYYYPGEYIAVVRVRTSDGGSATSEVAVTVKDASIKIASISPRGITLVNDDSRTLDLSLWRLSMGGQEFKIPEDTVILAGRTILFPSQVIELPTSDSATLRYPSGEVVATYPATSAVIKTDAVEQPSVAATSYSQVQGVKLNAVSEVGPIVSAKTVIPSYAKEAVNAPAAATELAAAGAALPDESTAAGAAPAAHSLFRSPWTFGFLGVMLTAATAFILL